MAYERRCHPITESALEMPQDQSRSGGQDGAEIFKTQSGKVKLEVTIRILTYNFQTNRRKSLYTYIGKGKKKEAEKIHDKKKALNKMAEVLI